MPLPQRWVNDLFAKLTVRYGSAFIGQYQGLDPELVKADWAEVLDGFSGETLAYGLRYLPERPPNAIQFRNLCRNAPSRAPALTHERPLASREHVAKVVAEVRARWRMPKPADGPLFDAAGEAAGDLTDAKRKAAEAVAQYAAQRGINLTPPSAGGNRRA